MSDQVQTKPLNSQPTTEVQSEKPKLKVVKDEIDVDQILHDLKINLPKNWGMTNGTANWNMKSKAMTLVKRLHKANKLSEKIVALEQYKDSYNWFLDSKVGSQQKVSKQVVQTISDFIRDVAVKHGVSEATLANLMEHFEKEESN